MAHRKWTPLTLDVLDKVHSSFWNNKLTVNYADIREEAKASWHRALNTYQEILLDELFPWWTDSRCDECGLVFDREPTHKNYRGTFVHDSCAMGSQDDDQEPTEMLEEKEVLSSASPTVPSINEIARVICETDTRKRTSQEVSEQMRKNPFYYKAAKKVHALLVKKVPQWVPLKPNSLVRKGTHFRSEWSRQGPRTAEEGVAIHDFVFADDPNIRHFVDLTTIPQEDPRKAIVEEWLLGDKGIDDLLKTLDSYQKVKNEQS